MARFLQTQGIDTSVITGMPNYPTNAIYSGYQRRLSMTEIIDGVRVHRVWLFVSQSRNFASRLLNYFSFVATSFFRLLFLSRPDVLVCESPPLFLGMTAVVICKLKRSKLVFNVSDLWPESAERLGLVRNRWLLRLSYRLECWIYRNSALVSGQTQGIVHNISGRVAVRTHWLPNGFDFSEGIEPTVVENVQSVSVPEGYFLVLYAGIIGHAQALDLVLRAAALLTARPVLFILAGDGPERNALQVQAQQSGLKNIRFIGHLPKAMVFAWIKACHAYLVPLRRLELFKGAIPSKIFEPMACGKPVLLGVDGEAKKLFVDEAQAALFFEPENETDLVKQINMLLAQPELARQLGERAKELVQRQFDRHKIHSAFLSALQSIAS
jgi:glycosyltransferase involved in cell wall biosynthesis